MSTAPAKCTKRSVDTEQGGITMRKSSKTPLSKDMRNAFLVLAGQGEDTLRMVS